MDKENDNKKKIQDDVEILNESLTANIEINNLIGKKGFFNFQGKKDNDDKMPEPAFKKVKVDNSKESNK